MFYKLNTDAPDVPDANAGCNLTEETSENMFELDFAAKKKQVANYQNLMANVFNVPQDRFFNAIPVNVEHLRAFITKNGGADFKACRIYITKDNDDPNKNDYELLFVPCIPDTDENGQLFFRDNIGADIESHTFSAKCKRPPGCGKGALLL